jgi:hypothetical protein
MLFGVDTRPVYYVSIPRPITNLSTVHCMFIVLYMEPYPTVPVPVQNSFYAKKQPATAIIERDHDDYQIRGSSLFHR